MKIRVRKLLIEVHDKLNELAQDVEAEFPNRAANATALAKRCLEAKDELLGAIAYLREVNEACRIQHDGLAEAFTNPPPPVADVMDGLAISSSKLDSAIKLL